MTVKQESHKNSDQGEDLIFHKIVRDRRIDLGYSMRDFCRKFHKRDPANWSKLERGILPPPQNVNELTQIANNLEIIEGSREWEIFFLAAEFARKNFKENVISDESVVGKLPIFFLGLKQSKDPDKLLNRLIQTIRKSETSKQIK